MAVLRELQDQHGSDHLFCDHGAQSAAVCNFFGRSHAETTKRKDTAADGSSSELRKDAGGSRLSSSHYQDSCELKDFDEKELISLVAELEAALEEERRKEEEELLVSFANELYLNSQADDDKDIAELEAFDAQLRLNCEDVFVLCPVCEKNRLFVNHGTIFCSCGMRINGGTSDNITLDMVRDRLRMVFEQHTSSDCQGKFQFYQNDVLHLGYSFLHVTCDTCGLAEIVF